MIRFLNCSSPGMREIARMFETLRSHKERSKLCQVTYKIASPRLAVRAAVFMALGAFDDGAGVAVAFQSPRLLWFEFLDDRASKGSRKSFSKSLLY